jgi:hypothetical protein
MIVRRKAFPNAAALGLSVLEHDDPKARDELSQLVTCLLETKTDIGEVSYGSR